MSRPTGTPPPDDVAGPPGLRAHLGLARGEVTLDLALDVGPGRVVALLGPNGAGKTTALHALAGLLPLATGRVELGGDVLDSPGGGVFVPPERRRVGVVFQDYLLFGHLSVLENVAFGPRARGLDRRSARARAAQWLDRVGVGDLAAVRPTQVSGGQAQRVALARALVTEPALLLLDEPLAALDAATRLQVRTDLRHHLAGFRGCTVLVTHDPLDAMVLADHLVVVENGRATQRGTPAEVARAPRTAYVARLMGLNLVRGHADGTTVTLADGGGTLRTTEEAHGAVFVSFTPAAVALHRERPAGSPRNVWAGRVVGMEQYAATVRVEVDIEMQAQHDVGGPQGVGADLTGERTAGAGGGLRVLADVTTGAIADLRLGRGEPVWASLKATETHVYPR